MVNKVTLIGHLGQDPELNHLESGTAVGRFSLATSETYKDASGEPQTNTEWHNVVVWRQQAEIAEKLLKKGSLVYVEGKISYRKYTDKNGIEKTVTDIVCNTFRIMGKKDGGGVDREAQMPTEAPQQAEPKPQPQQRPVDVAQFDTPPPMGTPSPTVGDSDLLF